MIKTDVPVPVCGLAISSVLLYTVVVGTYALSPPLQRRVVMILLVCACWMIAGVHVFEATLGHEKLATVVPWKSGDIEIRLGDVAS